MLLALGACNQGNHTRFVTAEEAAAASRRLAETESLRCELSVGASGTRSEKEIQYELVSNASSKIEFSLDRIDPENRRARMLGNNAAVDVTVLRTDAGLTFIELTSGGSVNTTTVFALFEDSMRGSFDAVQSRHVTITGGSPVTSQRRGICTAL
ncbi:MAG TPA: hypothetical protein VNJ04_17460 [Gemmatimonadaceae bacterium]|nr:hypothetical protein [Gemmatimonadaceae bacterium]